MTFHIENILTDLSREDVDAYFLYEFTNVEYLSGYRPTSFAYCIIKQNPIIYVSAMDMEIAGKNSGIPVKEYESFETIISDLTEEGIKTLAIEPTLPYELYVKLKDDFKITAKKYVDKQRMIKTSSEIEKITKATEIAQKSFLELDILNNKNTEREIAFDLNRLMIEKGALKESFDTIVTSGHDSSLPHAVPQIKHLEEPVLIDWGAVYQGYCSDNTRTMVYTEFQHEIFDIVAEAHDKAIKAIKPGLKCCEIDKVARDIITDYGYGERFIHSTGHSLGLDIHETPGFSTRDDTIIEKGMVITVEPGIYLEGKFGVRLEDTVSVTPRGRVIGDLALRI